MQLLKHNRSEIALAITIFFAAAGLATWLSWPTLTHYGIYKSDIRQGLHWASYHHEGFRDDDMFVEYAQFNESPLQNSIYWLGTWFWHVLSFSKWMSVISYGLGALFVFFAGRAMFGRWPGVLMVVYFTFLPDNFDWSAGFFARFWFIPLILLSLVLVEKKQWQHFIWLFPFAALAYAPSVIYLVPFVGLAFLLTYKWNWLKEKKAILWVCSAVMITLVFLLIKYWNPPEFIGPMVSGEELRNMPEMQSGGVWINPYIPISPLHEELWKRLGWPFMLGSSLLFFIVLGRKQIVWRSSWTALVQASFGVYILADVSLPCHENVE